jgi:hypothetical protein
MPACCPAYVPGGTLLQPIDDTYTVAEIDDVDAFEPQVAPV